MGAAKKDLEQPGSTRSPHPYSPWLRATLALLEFSGMSWLDSTADSACAPARSARRSRRRFVCYRQPLYCVETPER